MNAELSRVQGDANHATKCGKLLGFLVCDLSFSERIWGLSASSSRLFLQSNDQNKKVSLNADISGLAALVWARASQFDPAHQHLAEDKRKQAGEKKTGGANLSRFSAWF